MSVCEKCWNDAYLRTLSDPSKSQSEHYADLLEERKDNPCCGEPGNEAKKDEAPLKPKWIESLELKVRLSKSAGLKQVSLDYDEIDRLLKIANPD